MDRTEGFEQFAGAVSPMLYRTAWLLTGDRHLAEDLVQETLAKVFVRWQARPPIDNPPGYARTVLARLHVRGRRRRSASEVVTSELPEVGTNDDRTATIALRAALADMDPRDQAVLVLRYFADRTVTEVSADLQMTESAVRTRTSRAMSRLRARLGADFLSPST